MYNLWLQDTLITPRLRHRLSYIHWQWHSVGRDQIRDGGWACPEYPDILWQRLRNL